VFRSQFRFTAIRAHALLQNRFGRRRFIGADAKLCDAVVPGAERFLSGPFVADGNAADGEFDAGHLSAPAAEAFLKGLPGQGLRLLDLPSPSPFAFGLLRRGGRDTLQLAETADFLLAICISRCSDG